MKFGFERLNSRDGKLINQFMDLKPKAARDSLLNSAYGKLRT